MAKLELNSLSSGYNINAINVNFGKIETEFKDKVVYRNETSPMARDLDLNNFGVINLRNPVSNGDAVSYGFLLNSNAFSFTGLEYKGLWAPFTIYSKNNYVTSAGFVYIAQEDHTASIDFSVDLGAGRWVAFSSGGGDLVSTNNLSDVASASSSRANLNVPSRTGEGATGSWSINAATATSATNADFATEAGSFSGIQAIANGGTGQTTAANAFAALKQVASVSSTGVVELATSAETQAGTDTARAITPAGFAASSLGYGQTWADMTGIRSLGSTNTNATGRPILVVFEAQSTAASSFTISITVGAVLAVRTNPTASGAGQIASVSAIVPNGAQYVLNATGATLSRVTELR